MRHRLLICFAVCVCQLALPRITEAEEKVVRTFQYAWRSGDSCYAISERVYGSRDGIKYIHKYNPKMGKLPHNLKPGTLITLPILKELADAHVTRQRGKVRVKPSTVPAWQGARTGMGLFRAWRVNSRKRATAEITFVDKSRVFMREDTLVIIYGKSKRAARIKSTRAHLESGTLRARLAELDGKPKIQVSTKSSKATVGKSDVLVSVDDSQTARFANHKGSPIRVRTVGMGWPQVTVATGWGTKVAPKKKPMKPKRLPPTPTWDNLPGIAVGVSAGGASLGGSWKSVAKAARYRITLSMDTAGVDLIAALTIPATTTKFEAHGLPAGNYYVRIASIDNDKFESASTTARLIQVRMASVKQPGSPATQGSTVKLSGNQLADPMKRLAPPRVFRGTTVFAPPPIRCGLANAGAPMSAPVLLKTAGATTLICTDGGPHNTSVRLDVVGLSAVLAPSATAKLPRSKNTVVPIKLGSPIGVPSTIRVVGPPGLTIGELMMTDKGVLQVPVTPGADAPTTAKLQIVTGSGATTTTHATLTISISEPEKPVVIRKPAATPEKVRLRLGAFGGGTLFSDAHHLGNSADTSVVDSVPHLGLRVAAPVHRWLEAGIEVAYSRPGLSGGQSAKSVTWRALANVPIMEGKLVPLGTLTLGGRSIFASDSDVAQSDTDLEFGWGGGVRYQLAAKYGVRADARHILTSGRDGSAVTSFFEISAGFYADLSW